MTASTFGERVYTLRELARLFGWSYSKTKQYFRLADGVLRDRARGSSIRVPESVARREWNRLTQVVDFERPIGKTRPPIDWPAIQAAMARGEPVAALAIRHGISRAAIYKHLKKAA